MNVASFVPDDFVVPEPLCTEVFRLEPLGPEHKESDYAAWSSSVAHIHATPGFEHWTWPPDSMPLTQNRAELAEHAADFAARTGFTYTVLDPAGVTIGCVYIYPSTEDGCDAGVRSWVAADHAELDGVLYTEISGWLARSWPFRSIAYAPRPGM